MVYDEKEVLRSPSLSHLDDPGQEELSGFVDDYDASQSLVHLDSRKERRWWRNGKFLIMVVAVLALVGVCVGVGILLSDDDEDSENYQNHKKSVDSHKIPAVPSDLHVVCAPMNIQSDKGYNDCLESCQPAQCCEFIAENDLSCVEEHRNTCEKYRASCQHLDHKKATDVDATIDQLCATDALMTGAGVDACTAACEPFKCCFDDDSTDCDVSEALCSDNGACATALLVDSTGFSSTAEAKEKIQTACGDMSNYEGQTECTNVCNPAQCCFLSEAAWTHPCTVECDQYEPCSVLYGPLLRGNAMDKMQEVGFSIPHQVETACNPANLASIDGVRECFDVCQHHLCCFDKLEAGGCPDTNPDECHLYSACRALVEIDDNQEQPHEICEARLVALDGPLQCMQACRKGYCCLMDSRFESSCASDQICNNYYEGCLVLAPQKLPAEDPDLVKSISEVCTESNLGSMLGATECERDCSQRGCCIETGAGNCKTSDLQYCKEVSECQLLFEVDSTPEIEDDKGEEKVPDAVIAKLEQICREDNFSSLSGFHNCYDQCYYHLCCFSDDPQLNCKSTREEECTGFSPCESIMDTEGAAPDNVLSEVCASTSIETASGLEECRKQCAPKLCCFQDPNLPSSCIGWYGERECGLFEPCKILVSDASHSVYNQEDPYLVGLINNYCTPEKLTDDEDARSCMAHCEKRQCCFNEDGCWDTNHDWCNEIIACANHPLIGAHTGNTTYVGADSGAGGDDEPDVDEEDDVDLVGDDQPQDDSSGSGGGDPGPGFDGDDGLDLFGGGDGDAPPPGLDDGPDLFGGDGDKANEDDGLDLFGGDKGDSSGSDGNGEDTEPEELDDLDLFGNGTTRGQASLDQTSGGD